MEDVVIKEISYLSEEYDHEVALRDKILRRPLGLSLYNENLDEEQNDIHMGAFLNNCLVGVLILTQLGHGDYKMRQVAVDSDFQGKGIGKKLVAWAEEYIRKKGGRRILLHARKSAISFYEKLGYKTVGEEFTEVTIPHKKMFKNLYDDD